MCDLYLNTEMGLDTPPSFLLLIQTHQMQSNKDMETLFLPSCSRHIEQTDEDDIWVISDQQTNFKKLSAGAVRHLLQAKFSDEKGKKEKEKKEIVLTVGKCWVYILPIYPKYQEV
jgi:hypothetical protein